MSPHFSSGVGQTIAATQIDLKLIVFMCGIKSVYGGRSLDVLAG
jgi:hypothetical protein